MNFQTVRWVGRLLALWLLMSCMTQQALAHTTGESYSTLSMGPTGVEVAYSLRLSVLTQLVDPGLLDGRTPRQVFQQKLLNHYQLFADGTACERRKITVTEQQDFLRMSFQASCPEGEITLVNRAFYDLLPDQLHFARLVDANGNFVAERVMDTSNTHWLVPTEVPEQTLPWRYGQLGISHILGGYDHLAFLATVLLLVSGLRPLVLAITGFTLGHSMTLTLAVTGLVALDGVMIEALIGLTIALVAGEAIVAPKEHRIRYAAVILVAGLLVSSSAALLAAGPSALVIIGVTVFYGCYLLACAQRPALAWRLVPAVTFLFGLIHGFGFASSLVEIGLPTTRLVLSLLAFNLGIELGQLAIVLVTVVCLTLLQRYQPMPPVAVKVARAVAASGLMALGVFWFVLRAWA